MMNTVQRLDLLNLDEMANEQDQVVIQVKEQESHIIDDDITRNDQVTKICRIVEKSEEISIPVIPASILFDNFDSYNHEFSDVVPVEDDTTNDGNISFWGQSSDSMLGFLTPVVNDQDGNTYEGKEEEYHSAINNEFRLPKRVLTTISQNFSYFENLETDEGLLFDPILKKVEENKATPKKLAPANEFVRRESIEIEQNNSETDTITFSEAIFDVYDKSRTSLSMSLQSIVYKNFPQYCFELCINLFICVLKTVVHTLSVISIFFYHTMVIQVRMNTHT